jgi:hypothetical protein
MFQNFETFLKPNGSNSWKTHALSIYIGNMNKGFIFWSFLPLSFHFSLVGVVDFEKEVWPILQDRCVECHRAPYEQAGRLKYPKAGLRLDGAAHIMQGSDDGAVISVDHPSQSSLYTRVILPFDDDDHMPPKGEPLTQGQQETFRKWIAQGVDFGSWVGATDGLDKLSKRELEQEKYTPKHITFYQDLAMGMEALPDAFVDRLEEATSLLIRPIGIGSPLLEVRIVSSGTKCNTQTLKKLAPLSEHLVKLDLRGADLSSEGCSLLAEFSQVTHLNLRQSTVTDEGVKILAGMSNLMSLNLSSTQVTDYGVGSLLRLEKLKSLHLWGSQISQDRVQFLKNRLKTVSITP